MSGVTEAQKQQQQDVGKARGKLEDRHELIARGTANGIREDSDAKLWIAWRAWRTVGGMEPWIFCGTDLIAYKDTGTN